MALYVCAWMQDWNLSLAWISFHQSKNTRSSKATIESFKQPQWNLAKLQSPSPAEQGTNALIYTSTRFWREDKNELEKKALCGSCNYDFDRFPFISKTVQQSRTDDMDVGLVRMSLPQQLVNGRMDARGNRSIWLVQRYPGKVQKFMVMQLRVHCPLVNSP